MSRKRVQVFALVGLLALLAGLPTSGAELFQRFYDFTNPVEIPGVGTNPWRYDNTGNAPWTASQIVGPPSLVHWTLTGPPVAVNETYRMRRNPQGGDLTPLVTVYPWAKIKVTVSNVPAGEVVDVENQMRITNSSRRMVGHYYVGNGTYILTTYLADETFYFDDFVNKANPVPQAEFPLDPLTDTMYGRAFVNLDVTKVTDWATDWATRCGWITMDVDWLVITDNVYYPYVGATAGGTITSSPVLAGYPLTLTAPAGGGTVHYIWFKDGHMLADDPYPWHDRADSWDYDPDPDFTWTRTGTYSQTVSIVSASAGDSGTSTGLWDDGRALRETAAFDVTGPGAGGVITTDPPAGMIVEDHSLVMTAPSGTGYTWYVDGVEIAGENSQTLTFPAASETDEGEYICTYTSGTLLQTEVLDLDVLSAPPISGVITSNPPLGWIIANRSLVLTAPDGTAFQWYKDGEVLAGQNAQTLEFTPVLVADEGPYTCVYNNGGLRETEVFNLQVESAGAGGVITSDPAPGWIQAEEPLTLTGPAGSATYVWFVDGMLVENGGRISGADTETLVFSPVLVDDAGTYTVAYDDGSKATVESQPFVLEVLPAGSLPLVGLAGMAAVSAALAAFGARRLRRK